MNARRSTRTAVALLLLGALPACYSYVPLESGASPKVGQDVRVLVRSSADDGDGGENSIDGLVLGTEGGTLRLAVHPGRADPAAYSVITRDTLSVQMSDVTSIERHKLDAGRTALLIGLGAAGIAAAVIAVANSNPSNSAGGTGSRPRNSQGALIRIPLTIP